MDATTTAAPLDPACVCGRTDIGLDRWGHIIDHLAPGEGRRQQCSGSGDLRQPAITEAGTGAPGTTLHIGDRATVIPGDETSSPRPFGGRTGTVIALSANGLRARLDITGHDPLELGTTDLRDRFGRRGRAL